MKLSFLFLGVLLFITAYTQNQSKGIGIFAAPDFSHHYTKYEDLPIKIHENEVAKFGYKAGVQFNFTLKADVFTAGIGLSYANRGFQSKKIKIENTLHEPKIAEKQRYRYHFHYIDIPLQARYNFMKKEKYQIFTGISLIPSFMIRESMVHIYYFGNDVQRVRNGSFPNRFFNFFTEISMGTQYEMTQKYTLSIEPHVQYGWISLQNEYFVTRLWSIGLKTGLYLNW